MKRARVEVIKRDGIMVSDQLRLRQLGDEKIDQGRQGIPLRNIEAGVHHLPAEEGSKVISTGNKMLVLFVMGVLAGMAIIFGAEEGVVEERLWSKEMAAIENATKNHDPKMKFRFALMNDMTWTLAEEACSSISKEYELCTVSELCGQTEDGLKAHTLCQPPSQCEGLESVGGFKGRWAPVQKESGDSDGEWVNVEEKCKVGHFPADMAVKGILSCCHNGALLPIHPPPFPGAGGAGKAARGGQSIHSPEWEWSEYAAQVRQSDPFLKSKKEGSKMKGLHAHIQDGINQHLNGDTAKAITNTVKGLVGAAPAPAP